jgi:toluene monooxygenase electron transfer component
MLTHDVLILEMALERDMDFLAGQFVVLAVEGLDGFRAYSMVNLNLGGDVLELIVKRKPGGGLSDRLFDRDVSAISFNVFGPLGRATFDASTTSGSLVCAAGGTGIAGIMSILACASESGHLEIHKGLVCFGVRTTADLFFLDRFAALRRRHPDTLKVVIATSDSAVPESVIADYPTLSFERGPVHEVLAAEKSDGLVDPLAFIAGPPAAVEAITSVLLTRHGIPPDRLRFDRFG